MNLQQEKKNVLAWAHGTPWLFREAHSLAEVEETGGKSRRSVRGAMFERLGASKSQRGHVVPMRNSSVRPDSSRI